jgi:hypothetical protein
LARCRLDLDHPKFQIIGNASEAALDAGLIELRNKVAINHKISGFFNQPMPKFPDYQNKIWKWDFAPEGDRSGTRKGWRLYAYVADPNAAEPIPAIAFLCYDKKNSPTGDPVRYLVGVIRQFLVETIKVTPVEDRFRRQTDADGTIISLCYDCCATVAMSAEIGDVEIAEELHTCSTN